MYLKKSQKLAPGCQKVINWHKHSFSLFMFAQWESQRYCSLTSVTTWFTGVSSLSLSNIKLRRTLHGHGLLIQLDGENWLRKLSFVVFLTTLLWISYVLHSPPGCITGNYHGTSEWIKLQMPGSSHVTSLSWSSAKTSASIWPIECYTVKISTSHFINWFTNNITNSCTQSVLQARMLILLSSLLEIITPPC